MKMLPIDIIGTAAMLSVFSAVGTVSNAFTFFIFYQKRQAGSYVVFILALAANDFVTCLFTIPITVVNTLLMDKLEFDVVCKIYIFLTTSTVPFSAYILLAIAVDRYFGICRPFLKVMTKPRAGVIVALASIIAASFGGVTSYMYGTSGHFNATSMNANLSSIHSRKTNKTILKNSFIERKGSPTKITGFEDPDSVIDKDSSIASRKTVNKESERVDVGKCKLRGDVFSESVLDVYFIVFNSMYYMIYVTITFIYILVYRHIYKHRAEMTRIRINSRVYAEGSAIKSSAISSDGKCLVSGLCCFRRKTLQSQTIDISADAMNQHSKLKSKSNPPPKSHMVDSSKTQTNGPVNKSIAQNPKGGDVQGSLPSKNSNGLADNDTRMNKNNESSRRGAPPENNNVKPLSLESKDNEKKSPAIKNSSPQNKDMKNSEFTRYNTAYQGNGKSPDQIRNKQTDITLMSKEEKASKQLEFSKKVKEVMNFKLPEIIGTDSQNQTRIGNEEMGRQASQRPSRVFSSGTSRANFKTAISLFVITLIFLVTYLPALLMAQNFISFYRPVFYFFFFNNAVHPFIFALLEPAFRQRVKNILTRCCCCCCCRRNN